MVLGVHGPPALDHSPVIQVQASSPWLWKSSFSTLSCRGEEAQSSQTSTCALAALWDQAPEEKAPGQM